MGAAGARRRRDHDAGRGSPRSPSASAWRFYVFASHSTNQRGEQVCRGALDPDREAAAVSELEPGTRAARRCASPPIATPPRATPARRATSTRSTSTTSSRAPSGCPGGSCTASTRWRCSHAPRPRRSAVPSTSSGSPSSSAAPRVPEHEIMISSVVKARERPSASSSASIAQQQGKAIIRGATRRAGALRGGHRHDDATGPRAPASGGFVESVDDAHAPSGDDPAQGRRELRRDRSAGRVEDARRRPRLRLRALDDPLRAGLARGPGPARPPAHLGRAGCRPTPGSATSSTACSRRRSSAGRSPRST